MVRQGYCRTKSRAKSRNQLKNKGFCGFFLKFAENIKLQNPAIAEGRKDFC